MSRRTGLFPHRYDDPVRTVLMSLPFIDHERCVEIARSWDAVKPTQRIHRFLRWYTHNDRNILFILRGFVTVTPVVLLQLNVSVEYVVTLVVLGLFVTETLARKRESMKQARWIESTFEEYEHYQRKKFDTDPLK